MADDRDDQAVASDRLPIAPARTRRMVWRAGAARCRRVSAASRATPSADGAPRCARRLDPEERESAISTTVTIVVSRLMHEGHVHEASAGAIPLTVCLERPIADDIVRAGKRTGTGCTNNGKPLTCTPGQETASEQGKRLPSFLVAIRLFAGQLYPWCTYRS
jgi:hypothetical protein